MSLEWIIKIISENWPMFLRGARQEEMAMVKE